MMGRRIRKLHEDLQKLTLNGHMKTLRRVAMEADAYYRDNKQYMDAQFIPVILRCLEHAIQDIGKTKWSVARAKTDLRGRAPTHRKKPKIDLRLRRALQDMKRIDLSDE